MPRYKTKFAESWLSNSEYNGWLSKKSDSLAQCKYCVKDIDVSNMGETAIKSHMKGKKHVQKSPPAQSSKSSDSFPAFRVPNPEKPKPSQSSESPSSSKTVQESLHILVEKDNLLSAEIRWVLKCVQSRCSQRSCDDIQELLNIMFPGHILIPHREVCYRKNKVCIHFKSWPGAMFCRPSTGRSKTLSKIWLIIR